MKILLGLILCLTIQGIFLESSFALVDSNVREFLENRVNQWPELYLPNFKLSDTSNDLIYPKWFEGSWLVTSQDIVNDSEEKIVSKQEAILWLKNWLSKTETQTIYQSIEDPDQEFFEELLESTYELEIKLGYVIKWFAVRIEPD